MKHPTEAQIRSRLEEHHHTLASLVREANNEWTGVAHVFQRPHARTRAAFVSNVFADRARAAFDGVAGFTLIEESERLLMSVDGEFVIRFKLLDRVKRTHNYPTKASKRMDAQKQVEIAGVGKLPRVVLGYTVGGVARDLNGIFVLYAINRRPVWDYPIDGGAVTLPLPLPPDAGPKEHEFRLVGEDEELAEEDDDAEGETE